MNLREITEQIEREVLSEYAVLSAETKGRRRSEPKCEIRTEFQRDRDRITHSKAFRRLMHKTQVFITPEGDHYRNRLTHTLEVAQISRTIARALKLNEDLTEAIALGHDLGHTPFGHTGEEALDAISPEGFRHNEQSVRIVTNLEKGGKGLNLTEEVIDGILNHRSEGTPKTLEGRVVQISDKIGYINHDIDDAIRAGILSQNDLPKKSLDILGYKTSQRINFLVTNVITNSMDKSEVSLEPHVQFGMENLRQYMFETVYRSQLQKTEKNKIIYMLSELHQYFYQHKEEMPKEFCDMIDEGQNPERVVCDYIACMTDRFALRTFENIFMPNSWNLSRNNNL